MHDNLDRLEEGGKARLRMKGERKAIRGNQTKGCVSKSFYLRGATASCMENPR